MKQAKVPVAAVVALAILTLAGCGPKPGTNEPGAGTEGQAAGAGEAGAWGEEVTAKLDSAALPASLYVHIEVEGFGTIVARMHVVEAPLNVANVANLAIEGFYDGLTFHRIIDGFVIQGGDPLGTGEGGPPYTVPAEIGVKHTKGCMAMAREGDDVNPKMESSSCQFYFCLADIPKLDGKYTVIGQIVEGIEVMEAIGKLPTGSSDHPLEMVVMKTVWVSSMP